jgi:hypothetical protein
MAVIPVLAAGLVFALQSDSDKNTTGTWSSPGTVIPGDQGWGSPLIVPGERDSTKIECRNIFFGRGDDK